MELTALFLIVSLFVPRISLFVLYMQGLVPLNPTPFVADVFLSMLIPRAMVLILIAATLGFTGWFWVHLVVALIAYTNTSITYKTAKEKS